MPLRALIQQIQSALVERGHKIAADGIIGEQTLNAMMAELQRVTPMHNRNRLAWGAKVTDAFRDTVFDMAERLKIEPDYLMTVMAFETGRTFSPSIRNAAGSGATGLIQFMPSTAVNLGTTTEALAKMNSLEQLGYVEKYFKPYSGKIKTLSDVYMAVLWPAAIGRPEEYVLFTKGTVTYRQNSGLDKNSDGKITKAEVASKIYAIHDEGLKAGNVWNA